MAALSIAISRQKQPDRPQVMTARTMFGESEDMSCGHANEAQVCTATKLNLAVCYEGKTHKRPRIFEMGEVLV